jgi:hypothetical protein
MSNIYIEREIADLEEAMEQLEAMIESLPEFEHEIEKLKDKMWSERVRLEEVLEARGEEEEEAQEEECYSDAEW